MPVPASTLRQITAFFHRHPILLLLALTPGIPEYLSGSSTFTYLVLFPTGTLVFVLFLALNLGLYGPGVLLVREAWIRWGGGWGRLLLLGTAYGLLEEGTALSTLFDPNASVVGGLGLYGRWAGVNWVWLIGVIGVHVVLSVGLPIVLLGLALPETRGRPLLSRRGATVAAVIFGVDVVILANIVRFWRVEFAWLVGAAVVALLLGYVASRLPNGWLDPRGSGPGYRPRTCFLLGLAYFPVLLIAPDWGRQAHLPAVLTGAIDLGLAVILFWAARTGIGNGSNAGQLTMLAFGATLPVVLFGLIDQLRLPVVLGADLLYGLFFYTLWTTYRPRPVPPSGAAPELMGPASGTPLGPSR